MALSEVFERSSFFEANAPGGEDDAVVTERGVEWLYPPADQIRLIR